MKTRMLFLTMALAACSSGGGGGKSGGDAGTGGGDGGVPGAGTLNGPCSPMTPCGGGLECRDEVCQQPDCPSGRLGCPCAGGHACADPDGPGATCGDDERCALAGCAAGTAGCACDGSSCGDGLACGGGICRPAGGGALSVTQADARSCDVLLEDGGAPLRGAVFGADVIGESIRRAPRLAVSFIARGDAGFDGEVARIEAASSGNGAPRVVTAKCYDSLGKETAAPEVTVR